MTTPSKQAQAELQLQYQRVNSLPSARLAWERLFTEQDRNELGGCLDSAFEKHRGLVSMWMSLWTVSLPRATIDLGYELGFVDEPTKRWLLREVGEDISSRPNEVGKPDWDPVRGELRLNGEVIRKIASTANPENVVPVLMAFQELDWPFVIDDPLSNGPNGRRVNDTVASLNKELTKIRFHACNSGKAFRWNYLASDERSVSAP